MQLVQEEFHFLAAFQRQKPTPVGAGQTSSQRR
jgi:hypothetical protein